MNTKRCTLTGGPAERGSVDVAPNADETTVYFTPGGVGPIQRLVYRRVDTDRFTFVRSEPYTRAPEKSPIVVAHSEDKMPPEMMDWERRAC